MSYLVKTQTVDGKVYELREDGCYGCVAANDPKLCHALGSACTDGYGNRIWFEAAPRTVPAERVQKALLAMVYPYGIGYRSGIYADSEVPEEVTALLKELEQS